MPDFLQRFAVPDPSGTMTPGGPYKFSNIRSGLIVGLVSHLIHSSYAKYC